ncbi:MAG: EAL domain-containing protein [Chiayiivirga sp.]|jgi:diguanylate cyclase (GGDEF)-like protein/PAS domain S-box-containing protein|uniref:putative bifunctional diguanylate cyclase/phosphodiesterase n=1 Tax=Chiayiivirga sp. TaxID=2041042 RepID=UPI0025C0CF59|nr:EAL domain-containing protein [Chiayiivirga sp.]MCI1711737.1 EAL domain-containing protein [Chiayiivirga sp.]MCI1729683.1 EAL domain-containing protein [Chiayiivirga sp.]
MSIGRQLKHWRLAGQGIGPLSVGMGAFIVLLLPVAFGGLFGEQAATVAIDWVQVICVALAAALAWRIARVPILMLPQRRAFALLGLALVILAVADAGWAWVDSMLGQDPSASYVNWMFAPFYLVMLAGVIAFPRIFRNATDRLRFMFDAVIVTIGVGLLIWNEVAQPHLPRLGASSDALTWFVVIGQPLLDSVAVLAVAVLLLRLPQGPARQPMVWLALALVLNLLGNLVLAVLAASQSFDTGGIADLLWIGSRWCFVAAADSQLRVHRAVCDTIEPEHWSPTFQVLPYLGVAIGYATIVCDALGGGVSNANVLGAIVLTVLVLARQALDRREAERLLAERGRAEGDARLAALVEHASEAILVLDGSHRIVYASPAATRLFGGAGEVLQGAGFTRFVHPDERIAVDSMLRADIGPGRTREVQLRLQRHGDAWLWAQCAITDLQARAEVAGIVLNVRDISAQRELEDQLRRQTFHDPLTGLCNRVLFAERVIDALAERRGDEGALAVMFVDLDHFKVINDSLGHGSGDAVVVQVARRLEGALRERDVLARLGGDEFALMLQGMQSDDDVVAVAQRVRAVFAAPFPLDGREVAVSASLGIAWAAPQDTKDLLLRNADLALNEAKARGRDRFHVFQPDLHHAVMRKLQLHGLLREWLDGEGFSLAYQPIVRLDAEVMVGVEALLRLPPHGEVQASTAEAVAAAEESGLIVPLGRWVLERALRELRQVRQHAAAMAGLQVTVNLSPRQLHDPELPGFVAAALQRNGIAAEHLALELTETAVTERPEEALAALQRLKAQGVRLAIDDFGTGYSSLSQLARFPFDLLKVAKPFVDMIDTGSPGSDESARVARAVLALGESLNLITIAEGVEQRGQLDMLRESGCDLAQGYFLARPMSLPELLEWLESTPLAPR